VKRIVPEMDGLHINPCLPSQWTQAKMTRQYRGATYEITINKPTGIQKGNVTVTLDGKKLPGNVISPQGDGKKHKVVVNVTSP
jgi:cellobiose phosphorylase